jgi:N12 class adenine-specific DNA methylase
VVDPGGTPLPVDPSEVEALPLVAQDEMGVPVSQLAKVRAREARRPDGSRVWVKADHLIAGLEPDPEPTETPAPSAAEEPTVAAEVAVEPVFVPPVPFTHPGGVLVPSGEKARARANIAALEVARSCDQESRYARPDEQQVLSAWSGWGGCPNIFDDQRPEWEPERAQLADLLTEGEYREARASTLNAHYTDPAIAQVMWTALEQAGFDGGRVLEPGCGSGNFIGLAPESATMVGVELDPTTARIAHLLYPQAQVRNEGFEQTRVPDHSFTATIGNVPFGSFSVPDPVHNPGRHRIHNHFVIKSLHLTAPGGYVGVITSAWTMDSTDDKARREIHDMADLVGAVRLPSNAFARVAATQVVTDVLVFRKREPGDEVPNPATVDWLHLGQVWVDGRDGQRQLVALNQFFDLHPEAVLGEVRAENGMYRGNQLTVVAGDLAQVPQQLSTVLSSQVATAVEQGKGLTARPRAVRPSDFEAGMATARELYGDRTPIGRVEYDTEAGEFVRQGLEGREVVKIPRSRSTETRHLLRLRDVSEATIAAQRGDADFDTREALRAELGTIYDGYLAAYGPINRAKITGGRDRTPAEAKAKFAVAEQKWREKNADQDGIAYAGPLPESVASELEEKAWQASPTIRRQTHIEALRQDPSLATLLALERYDSETGEVSKTAIFSRDVVTKPAPMTSAQSPEEAVSIVLGESGTIDLERVADLLGTSRVQAREQIRGLVYADPDQNGLLVPAAVALSGNVLAKHERALAAAENDPGNTEWAEYAEALSEVIPELKQPSQIGAVTLGATWIEPADYALFVREVFGAEEVSVNHTSQGWDVNVPSWQRNTTLMRTDYGADHAHPDKAVDAVALYEALLNQRPIVVKNPAKLREDTGAPEVDAQATILAQVQARKIVGEFRSWLWSDDERRDRLVGEWNRRFNSWVPPKHDGRFLQLPGLSPAFSPHPYQRDAVARIAAESTVLLDHVVGAGKTGTMFMAAMELKRRGVVAQPWIVVPTHLIEQFGREVKQWYPAAEVLVGNKGMSAQDRRMFVAQTATSNWDMVIVPGSVFELINVSEDRRTDYLQAQIDQLGEELSNGRDSMNPTTIKKIETAKKRMDDRLQKLLDKDRKDDGVTFEQTGCDYLFIDEAHEYKNKARTCAIDTLAHTGSQKAEDLSMKLDLLRERVQDQARAVGHYLPAGAERVATFATGTPIANSLSEAWVMQQYLRPDVLETAGVRSVTDWAASFTTTKSETITNATGTRLKVVTTVSAFANPREMFAMAAQYTDVVTRAQVPANLPTYNGRQIITTIPGQEVADFIADLEHRLDHLDPRHPELDNTLKVLSDGRNVALDPRLANLQPDPGNTRSDAVAEQVAQIYHDNAGNEYRTETGAISPTTGGLQLIFCDRGTPQPGGGWSAYEAVREGLIERGVPAEKIAFIHDAKSPSQKLELAAQARSGQIAVLLGSTKKMGTGMNVQDRMVALHHMDVPWRPADLEQREGRIIRQGNQNEQIQIFSYVTAGTTDTVMWGKVESKAAFIEQAKSGQLDPNMTEVEDIDAESIAAAAAATKAAATGDERFMTLVHLEDEVKNLEALSGAHADSRRNARSIVRQADKRIPELEAEREELERLTAHHEQWAAGGKPFTVNGQEFAERTDRSRALLDRFQAVHGALKGQGMGRSMEIAEFEGGVVAKAARIARTDELWVWIDVPGQPQFTMKPEQLWPRQAALGEDPQDNVAAVASGLATRLENAFERMPDKIGGIDREIDRWRREIEVQSPRMDAVFAQAGELQAKQVQMQQLRIDIEASQNTPEAIAAREAADQRLLEAGRAPGWSLMLNPTKAMVEGSPFLTANEFVASTQRGHMLEAARYARDQRRRGGAQSVLEATADHPRQHMQHSATVIADRPEHRPTDQDGQHHGHRPKR